VGKPHRLQLVSASTVRRQKNEKQNEKLKQYIATSNQQTGLLTARFQSIVLDEVNLNHDVV